MSGDRVAGLHPAIERSTTAADTACRSELRRARHHSRAPYTPFATFPRDPPPAPCSCPRRRRPPCLCDSCAVCCSTRSPTRQPMNVSARSPARYPFASSPRPRVMSAARAFRTRPRHRTAVAIAKRSSLRRPPPTPAGHLSHRREPWTSGTPRHASRPSRRTCRTIAVVWPRATSCAKLPLSPPERSAEPPPPDVVSQPGSSPLTCDSKPLQARRLARRNALTCAATQARAGAITTSRRCSAPRVAGARQ